MALLAPRPPANNISPDGKIEGDDGVQVLDTVVPDVPSNEEGQIDTTAADQTDSNTKQSDDVDFSFDAFKAAKTLDIPDPLVPKKEDEVKEEDAEPTKIDTQEDLDRPQPQKIVTKKAELPDKRDYTGIAPELIPHFKRMSNDSFAAIKPLLQAKDDEIKKRDTELTSLRQGKTIIPDSYYEHERAYMLTPEFETAVTAANEAETVYRHWESQLNDVRQGAKSFKTIVRNAQGQLSYGADLPADASAETKLMGLFNSAHNQLMTYNGKLAAVQESYKGNYQNAKQWVDEINTKTFSAFVDPKTPLAIAAKEYVDKTMPATFRNNPLAGTLARSLVTTAEMYKMLVQAKQMLESKGLVKGKQINGKQPVTKQPTLNDINNDGGGDGKNGSTPEVTMDDFKAVKGV